VESDVLDENEMQLNPLDFDKGNKVRMAVRMTYGYYKTMRGSNEFSVPRKLLIIQRLDQNKEEGGRAKRARWAAGTAAASAGPAPGEKPSLFVPAAAQAAVHADVPTVVLPAAIQARVAEQTGKPPAQTPATAPAPAAPAAAAAAAPSAPVVGTKAPEKK
jgi:hypothetical protein